MKPRILYQGLRVSAACALSVFVAYSCGLHFFPSSCIITLLSLQETKKQTLVTGLRRVASFALSMILAFSIFGMLGFTITSLLVFLASFMFLSFVFQIADMIAICAVLGINVWNAQTLSAAFFFQLAAVLTIGIGTAIIFNLFLSGRIKRIREDTNAIDTELRSVLAGLSEVLKGQRDISTVSTASLRDLIAKGAVTARQAKDNALRTDLSYFVNYVDMRQEQLNVLKRIEDCVRELQSLPEQAVTVSDLLIKISGNYYESNDAVAMLAYTEGLLDEARTNVLPSTREEFEARAILFQILIYIENFLIVKRDFALALTEDEKKMFWQGGTG